MKEVLIIEDDKLVSLTLKSQLESKGFAVTQVFNGLVTKTQSLK